MGKLGGREMTATSDLDLILLYDHDAEAGSSDGDKPISPSQYYIRLTQRLVSALSAPTAEGTLYEVDFRLRPSGNAGPLATRIDAFESYQHGEAWIWEHMALTRARAIAGSPHLQRRFEALLHDVLTRPRDRDEIRRAVGDMRARIYREKGSEDIWDLKQVSGGLVDVEFIAQYLQLIHAAEHPDILDTNTAGALTKAARLGLLDAASAEILLPAVRLYHDLTQILRLCIETRFEPAEATREFKELLAQAGTLPDFSTLEAHLRDTEAAVRGCFAQLIGPVD
ncbi:MAG: bifunctional [glutamine synthetase] adenylyltransferase/[glutamine synthetase]-adenylyl-L-tyrosine phosphorylase, partial [Hyphomicrobiales bacterium]|nr:bifunctional [glutamine synthetase] adenylyltransferase/[glutamine synthetase]-adenylyl-L-tyrosine phosphorylase [Hyphomicrobiales bacterium]